MNKLNASLKSIDENSLFSNITIQEAAVIKGGEHKQKGKPKRFKNTP